MYIKNLQLINYRNYEELQIDFRTRMLMFLWEIMLKEKLIY